jgi:selenocysteine-specific elongation factor
MRVIGTAGHVDHGKSTLIASLTGTHPDRLKEEQRREMTIELGFGWMTLPNGEEVGIVDVPGHRDFIENMLSGIGGIDAVLLVIAADEGIMPQTREHLAIIDLLHIPAGLVVLTKTDLAPEAGWLDLLEADIRGALADTVLSDAPILRVSAKTKKGLDVLTAELATLLQKKSSRPDLGRPRLPIDRVFSMSGFGTVVTGTLSDGHLSAGDEIEILPAGHRGRIRGLQSHKKSGDRAVPGSRTAVNISGVETSSIFRGDVLVQPGQYQVTRRVDAQCRLLQDATSTLKHGDEVKVFVGASESIGMLRLLGTDEIKPGEQGWIQLELRHEVVAVRGDRYILRRPSPGETLGGGVIVDPHPRGRHKRFDEKVLSSLSSLAQGSPTEILFETTAALQGATVHEIMARSHLDRWDMEAALEELLQTGRLVLLDKGSKDGLVMTLPQWNILQNGFEQSLDAHHKQFPLRRGMPREELKNKLDVPSRLFNAVIKKLAEENLLVDADGYVRRTGHKVRFDDSQQARVKALMDKFDANPYATPSIKESRAEVGDEIFNALVDTGKLVPVSQDVVFHHKAYQQLTEMVASTIRSKGQITLAEARDLTGTSRKYIQALLEHLDATGLTIRDGDARKLGK